MNPVTPWLRLAAAAAAGVLIGAGATGKMTSRELKHYSAAEVMASFPLADEGPTDDPRYVIWTVDPARNTFHYVAAPRNERGLQLVFSAMDRERPPLKTSLRVLSPRALGVLKQPGRSAVVPFGEGPSPGLAGVAPLSELLKYQDETVPLVEDVPVAYRQTLSLRFWQAGQSLPMVVTLRPHKSPVGITGEIECTGWWPTGTGRETVKRKIMSLFPDGRWGLIAPTDTSPVIAYRVIE